MVPGVSRDTGRAPAAAVVVSNLVPLVGVLALGWSTAVFLGVYLLELAAVVWWTLVRIPFAEKRPNNALGDRFPLLGPLQEKRGATRVPGPFPPVYLRNVPTLVAAVLLGALAFGAGFVLFALSRPDVTVPVAQSILLGGLAVFCTRGVETWLGYFRGGGYRAHSPRSLLLTPFKHLLGVGALLLVAAPLERSTAGVLRGPTLLAAFVAGKLAYDLRALWVRRDEDRRGLFARLYGSERTEISPERVETPAGEPLLSTGPTRRIALLDAALHGLAYGFLRRGIFVAPILALAVLGDSVPIATAGLALGLGLAGLRALTRYLRHGTLEYRCYDDVVVVHDTLLDEPQARLERRAVTGAAVTEGRVDRLAGTETLRLSAAGSDDEPSVRLFAPEPGEIDGDDANANRTLHLVHVPDARAVADALGISWRLEQ